MPLVTERTLQDKIRRNLHHIETGNNAKRRGSAVLFPEGRSFGPEAHVQADS